MFKRLQRFPTSSIAFSICDCYVIKHLEQVVIVAQVVMVYILVGQTENEKQAKNKERNLKTSKLEHKILVYFLPFR